MGTPELRVKRFDMGELSVVDSLTKLLAPAERWLASNENSRDHAAWERAFGALTAGQRMLFAVNSLEMEVNSGGFENYFRSSGANAWRDAVKGLREIGAPEAFGRALAASLKVFPGGSPPEDWGKRDSALDELTEEGDPFEEMDLLFFDSYGEKELGDFALEYVMKKEGEFLV